MSRTLKRRLPAVLVVGAMAAAAAPVADASAATLKLRAPSKIDQATKFRVTALGTGRRGKTYSLSVLYHNNDQGACAPTVGEEITQNRYFSVFYLYPVKADQDGRYKVKSRRIFGGAKNKGKFCGYLTDKNGNLKDRVVRPIEFT